MYLFDYIYIVKFLKANLRYFLVDHAGLPPLSIEFDISLNTLKLKLSTALLS